MPGRGWIEEPLNKTALNQLLCDILGRDGLGINNQYFKNNILP